MATLRWRGAVLSLLSGLLLAAPASAVVVNGTVTLLADGQPAVGAQVSLFRIVGFSEEPIGTQTVTAAGTYSFSEPFFGNFSVTASLPQPYIAQRRNFFASDDTPVVRDFQLSLPSTLTVTVRDAVTQALVSAAPVRLTQPDGGFFFQINTNAQGQARFNLISGGPWKVCVIDSLDAYRNECYENQFLAAGDDITNVATYPLGSGTDESITMQLDLGATLSGTLTDRYFQQPIAGEVTLNLYAQDGTPLLGSSRAALPGGAYELRGLPPGSYRLGAQGAGTNYYTPRVHPAIDCVPSCTVTDGTLFTLTGTQTIAGIDFDLHPGAVVVGTVTETGTGAPIANADVVAYLQIIFALERARTTTNAAGQYTLAHIPPGPPVLLGTSGVSTHVNESWPNLPCYVLNCTNGQNLAFTIDQVSTGFDWVLDPGGAIQGSVEDPSTGAPLVASVQIRNAENTISFILDAPASPDGYSSIGLPPGTYYAAARLVNNECEVYNEQPCAIPVPIDPALATPITISGPNPVTGIDFTFPSDPFFDDGFED